MTRCKKCNKELASDHRGKKCDNCKNKALEYAKTIFLYGSLIGGASATLLLSYTKNETASTHDEERDDEIDESLLD